MLIGEKSSLADILSPLADRYDADLFLPTGEISDTQIYLMARAAGQDGRPFVVFYFADCDPAGWQMGISVSRKLQALKILLPGMPDFEVYRVALLPAQVREYGLRPRRSAPTPGGRPRESSRPRSTRSPRSGPSSCANSTCRRNW